MAASIWEHLSVLPDPRVDRPKLHQREDILILVLCAVICGAETWVDLADFAKAKEAWLRTFLKWPNGIPSHDTFGRVLAALEVRAFERAFQSWILDGVGTRGGKRSAIDGKTIRRSLDRASGKAAIHLVSAWVHENHAVFGPLAVEGKSNEITALPKRLEMLNLPQATVTIDARGCQRDLAPKVLDQGGPYVRAVQAHQGTLYEDIRLFLDDAVERDFRGIEHDLYEQTEKGQGRLETRRGWTTSQIDWRRQRHHGPGLNRMAAVDGRRQRGEQVSTERRYFLSSLPGRTAQRIGQAVRRHGSVENERHGSLDLCFGEDQSRARISNAAENLSRVRRLALTLLKQETTAKIGIKAKRLMAGWDEKYLLRVLKI